MSGCFSTAHLIHTHLLLVHVIRITRCVTLKRLHEDNLCYVHKLVPVGDKSAVRVRCRTCEGSGGVRVRFTY